ncbi:hypothetical protein L195_g052651 [Trifolium pratense]|uniref:Uncharacterized protein n=1 Tax=Trifolium pratense TaxID=57577 RepID=A0A2K3K6A8_TRIPR|nr:hypothetical protein L195_g052651 [Trifolium pratense]
MSSKRFVQMPPKPLEASFVSHFKAKPPAAPLQLRRVKDGN